MLGALLQSGSFQAYHYAQACFHVAVLDAVLLQRFEPCANRGMQQCRGMCVRVYLIIDILFYLRVSLCRRCPGRSC